MTMGWGGFNFYWRKPLFVAPVRHVRFTHQLLEKNGQFTVCVPKQPLDSNMKSALQICGTKSGRDIDKWAECGLVQQNAKEVNVPIVGGCGIIVECKVVYKQDFDTSIMPPDIQAMYQTDGTHTLYYGEIVACYRNE